MQKISCLVIVFVVILAGPSRPAAQPGPALPDNIKKIIGRNCSVSGCHQGRYPAANMNFEPDKFIGSTWDKPSQEVPDKKIIDASASEKSYLLAKIKGEPGIIGARMPAGRAPLSADEIKAVEAWLASLENDSHQPRGTAGNSGGGDGLDARPEKDRATATRKMAVNKPAFWGTRVINLPTAETLDRGRSLFRISHRFIPAVASGWDGFYGVDGPAFILLSFGYGITDRLMMTVGRTNHDQEWELNADYRVFEPSKDSARPLSGALHIGGSVVSKDEPAGAE
jgi:hypothetical protein